MRIFLSGGERGAYRTVLVENHAPRIAMNLTQFTIPKKKELDLKETMGGAEICVYTSDEDENVDSFDSFIRENLDSISLVIGRMDYNGDWLGSKYAPLWNDEKDLGRLDHLCQKYGTVAISDRAITARTLPRIKQVQQRWGTKLVGMCSKVDIIESIPWDTVIVSSWTSTARYGETQVWDGHGLRRYPAQKKESSRKKHRPDIVRMGLDFDAILEDDVKEVQKLAVMSWRAWEESTFGTAYQPSGGGDDEEFEEAPEGEVVAHSTETQLPPNRESSTLAIAHEGRRSGGENGRQLLPVMGMETVIAVGSHNTANGDDSYEIGPQVENVVSFKASGLRQCDSCYLATRCPRFEAQAECAYEIPIEMKTKEQLRAVLRAMLEMQTSRIMFAAFAEQLEGQGMDPALSKELDRLFDLTQKFKEIEDTRDMVKFSVEAHSSAGVISRLFGGSTAQKLNQLSEPMPTAAIDQAIIDAEVLDSVPETR